MKTIEVDEELYRYIASQTHHIGESASDILRRLLGLAQFNGHSVSATRYAEPESAAGSVSGVSGPDGLLDNLDLTGKDSAIDRFMAILTALYQTDAEAFTRATEIKGRKRVYFARTEEELLATGNTTKPRAVQGTPYWVISNTNTGRKRNIVSQLMTSMGYGDEFVAQVCEKI